MPKIAVIHHSGIIGGAGVSLLNTVRSLASGNEVAVFVSGDPDDMRKKLEELRVSDGIKVVDYGRRIGALTYYSGGDGLLSPRFFYRALLILKQWRMWQRYINEQNPDVVMVNSMILAWMSLLPEIRRRKTICFVRETMKGMVTSCVNRVVRMLLGRFSKVVFLSEYDRQSWGLKKDKSYVIRNYIDTSALDNTITRDVASERFALRTASFHLLYVGGVSHMKGFDLIVKAVLDSEKDVELICAGTTFDDRERISGELSAYEKDIKQYIGGHANRHRIHLVGRQMNMSNCYAAADALVFPMRSPHQARPVFEAGWFGIPAVITDFDNIREDVRDGYNGLTFESENVDDLRNKLETLSCSPELTKEMGRNNKKMTLENHDREVNSRQITELIDHWQ